MTHNPFSRKESSFPDAYSSIKFIMFEVLFWNLKHVRAGGGGGGGRVRGA